jgi:hypothetical protein
VIITTITTIELSKRRRGRHRHADQSNHPSRRFFDMNTASPSTTLDGSMNDNNSHDATTTSSTPTVTFSTTTTIHTDHHTMHHSTPNVILYNFIVLSILFSSNHGCVVACLSLATARLGSLGAYQNGTVVD